MQSALNAPHLINEAAAFTYVEARLWPHGATCPHCGVVGRSSKSKGKTTRAGLWNCRACRKPFTVRMGTIFESSHVPLHVWLQAIYLVCSSKKGISTRQIQRTLGGSMKTAWFLMHRIREAMADEAAVIGGGDGVIEVDETFLGSDPAPSFRAKAGAPRRARPGCRRSSPLLSVVAAPVPSMSRACKSPRSCAPWKSPTVTAT